MKNSEMKEYPVSGGGGCLEAHQPLYTNKIDLKNLFEGFLSRLHNCTHQGCDLLNTWGRIYKIRFSPHPLIEGVRRAGEGFGFTLAEVLITLGIIGIVAAMTMPTLMANYKRNVYETSFMKTMAVVQQGIKNYIGQQGCTDLECAGVPLKVLFSNTPENQEKIDKFVKSSFKTLKTCKAGDDDCGKGIIRRWFNVKQTSPADYFNTNYVFVLPTGAMVAIDTILSIDMIVFDTNGNNGPNRYAIDTFFFTLDKNGNLKPLGAEDWQSDTLLGQWRDKEKALTYCGKPGKKAVNDIPMNDDGSVFSEEDLIPGWGCGARIIEEGGKITYF